MGRSEHDPEPDQGGSPTFSPSAELPPLSAEDLAALRRLGERWQVSDAVRALPVDPQADELRPSAGGAPAPAPLFLPDRAGQLTATAAAERRDTPEGRAAGRVRRLLLGRPLSSASTLRERMPKVVALPVLASDLLSSVAYGPEAMLVILVLAGSGALGLSLPIAAALVLLMLAVGISYRQTVQAYPHGAGSYLVASDSLGPRAGLAAAAGLILDYVLTVAVSVTAGVAAITSALPALVPYTIPMALAVIGLLLTGNLRGIRVAGNIFAAPTYLFLVAIVGLIAVGLVQAAARGFTPTAPPATPAVEGLGLLVVMRAFASGATSMTGIEAVSNAVPVFRPVEWRNARTVLTWMVGMLIFLFTGLTLLFHLNGLVPRSNETLLSQLAHVTFPHGPWYWIIQAATALVLLLAANTAFNDLPRLLYFMARDSYVPRRFLHIGDRLALSNGLILLAVAAAVILVAFGGRTHSLIPLYAVGVFLAFTLSQTGMINHWRRHRGPGWRRRAIINGVGAALSAVVLVTAAVTKFAAGAWVVVLAVPLLIFLSLRVRRHYDRVRHALSLDTTTSPERPSGEGSIEEQTPAVVPQQVRHLFIVPVARLNQATLRTLAYVGSLGQPTLALHISPEPGEADNFRGQWATWGGHIPLETIQSPHRVIIQPVAEYVSTLRLRHADLTITVVVPDVVVEHPWQRVLHYRTEQRLRRALRRHPGIIVANVPTHLSV
ncbi:amino acid permease [Micromonospora craterilacus]|uniref:Amino acid permease n=1 Tax=Micromonospora craterilacus TaxID=1655439 RepID=A0A2W2FSW8_9ACTN|nr:APC family permease [Micromonospora craterilacus]PZG18134.1 amino acid permease [Micromonospora craterilacus]